MNREGKKTPILRRHLLKVLASLGIGGPLALESIAQSKSRVSAPILKDASAVLGEDFSDARINVIEAALQRNLDQFQILRDFEVDDLVEPAPLFLTKRYAGDWGAERVAATAESSRRK
jgi:hypothetical protein